MTKKIYREDDLLGPDYSKPGEDKMTSKFASFKKVAQVIDHVLVIEGVRYVDSVFGESFYISCYDETTGEKIIVTGGSIAISAQLHGVDDPDGLRVVIRERGKSYAIESAE